MMAKINLHILLFVVNSEILQTFCRNCSFSRMTKIKVEKCPASLEEWTNAAMSKNCSLISQTCVPSSEFKYHCVRNAFSNATVEVCAPIWRSTGYCVEYNEDGEVIQDNYYAPCTNFSTPCPVPYISTDIYKYQQCFRLIKSNNTDYMPIPKESSFNAITGVVIGLSLFFVCLIVICVVCYK
ncbi:uncharacterized protein LOC134242668, partial [Saccostrea cucullata]|uniref:uncharacterized protein LOC134242668 n=1 Tax=Saccostrea cuccullata TaxID=36930 RepID=UPI002ED39C07